RYSAAGPPGVGFVAQATLRHLIRRGPYTVSDLAAADQVTTQAISLRVRPLLDAGLISRDADASDGRRTLLSATDAGRNAISAASSTVDRAMAEAVAALTVAERTALSQALPALARIAENLQSAGGRVADTVDHSTGSDHS